MKANLVQQHKVHNYSIIQNLNNGMFSDLYKVQDSSSNIYVLKLFNRRTPHKIILNEIKIGIYLFFKEPENPHLIKYISSETELSSKRTYILYEFTENISLENKIVSALYFEEKMAMIIFWNVAKEVKNLHEIGIANIDISLENILVEENYNLKLAGFENAKFIKDNLISKDSLIENDIFHLGVLLLQLVTGRCDIKYLENTFQKIIQKGGYKLFWKMFEIHKTQKLSKELRDLVYHMLSIKYNNHLEKITLDKILNNQALFQEMESEENINYMKEKLEQLEESEGSEEPELIF